MRLQITSIDPVYISLSTTCCWYTCVWESDKAESVRRQIAKVQRAHKHQSLHTRTSRMNANYFIDLFNNKVRDDIYCSN